MIHAYTAAAVRAAEQPRVDADGNLALMRLAAHGLAGSVLATLRSRGAKIYGARIVLLVGSGNNGGDALFAGARLASLGAGVQAFLTGPRTHPEALAAFRDAGGQWLALADSAAPMWEGRAVDAAGSAAVVLDGLLGTGARGGLRGAAATVVDRLQQLQEQHGAARPAVVACDLPSGVDATTGQVEGPVLRAERTVTFGAYKSGLLTGPGERLCGTVELVDLGIGPWLGTPELMRLQAQDVARALPAPDSTDHKYTRGVAGIIAGSAAYPGAALLATAAASACGPGMVRYLGPEAVAAALQLRNPEVVSSQDMPQHVRVQAWLVGPGINEDSLQLERARAAMHTSLPTVVDAAALPLVEAGANNQHLILTPHAGELAQQLQRWGHTASRADIESAPLAAARMAARLSGAVVLLKGATTVVAEPAGTIFTQANGLPRLATAGSGDTLAGILVALLAMTGVQGTPPAKELARTAALAAALHGELSQLHPGRPLNAGLLARTIPEVWDRLAHQGVGQGSQGRGHRQLR